LAHAQVDVVDGELAVELLADVMRLYSRHRRGPPARSLGFGRRAAALQSAAAAQTSLRSCHFAKICRHFWSASLTASSGEAAPVAALANIVLMTQVPKISSTAALA